MNNTEKKPIGSMRLRFLLIIIGTTLLACIITILSAFMIYSKALTFRYENLCATVSETIAGSINADSVNLWLDNENTSEYIEYKNILTQLANEVSDLQCIKIYQMRNDGMYTVFDTESNSPRGGLGVYSKYDRNWEEYKEAFLTSKDIGKIVISGKNGKTLMYCVPVFDSESDCVCYACSGISMSFISSQQNEFLRKYSLPLIMLALFISLLSALYIERKFTRPLTLVSRISEDFIAKNEYKSFTGISPTLVKTGDEIENIWHSLTKICADKMQLNSIFESIQDDTVVALASLIKRKDGYTSVHIDNTIKYVMLLTDALRKKPKYKDTITDEMYDNILHSAPLHDIGKLTIPDSILNKPSKLTDEEFEKMKQHTIFGAKLIEETERNVENAEYLEMARQLAESHHERWDGKGYPYGLAGEEIPLAVRIITIADVFDALVSKRCYRDQMSVDEAFDIIIKERGSHFDPDIVDVFVEIKDELLDSDN